MLSTLLPTNSIVAVSRIDSHVIDSEVVHNDYVVSWGSPSHPTLLVIGEGGLLARTLLFGGERFSGSGANQSGRHQVRGHQIRNLFLEMLFLHRS